MKILVTTPTGKIGRLMVSELLAPEFTVRVIVRDPARLHEDIAEKVEVIDGSSDDARTISRALEDVEALFWCVPSAPLHSDDLRGHYERFAYAASRVLKQTATPRVVTISGEAQGLAGNPGPLSDLRVMEDILNESAINVCHLRCGFFMENFLMQRQSIWEDGLISYPIPGHIPQPMVATRDIADTALRWLVRRDWKGKQAVPVHSPESITMNQAAAIIERVLQRPVRYTQTSVDGFVRPLLGLGASPEYAHEMFSTFEDLALCTRFAAEPNRESATTVTLADWCESELASLIEDIDPTGLTGTAPACACSCDIGISPV
jgi:uncharacterized protein YbjT (DUF2867 family)